VCIVAIENLEKTFGHFNAVQNLDLVTEDGEFIVLVGPSGCGKTTSMRMIAGLEHPTSGSIRIDGKDVTGSSPSERDVAMVFQNYALYPHLSVYENMAFCLHVRKWPKDKIEQQIHQTARILGIENLLQRKPAALSGGQRQRVALGRAIVRQPKIFLMDEPLSNLDAKLRIEMRTEIIKLCRRLQITTFYVTHDQFEALTMGHRVVVMDGGRVQQIDTPQMIYDRPANQFVAGFIGSPPMNFLEADSDGHGVVSGAGFRLHAAGAVEQALAGTPRKVVAGIRPEHLYPLLDANAAIPTLHGRIDLIEQMGSQVMIQTLVGSTQVCAQFERGPELTLGQEIRLTHRSDCVHAFDLDNGHSVLAGSA